MADEARQSYFDPGGASHGIALVHQPGEHLCKRVVADFRFGKRRAQIGLWSEEKSQLQAFSSSPLQKFADFARRYLFRIAVERKFALPSAHEPLVVPEGSRD